MHQCPKKELKLLVWEQEEDGEQGEKIQEEGDKVEKDDWEIVCHVAEIKDLRSQPWVHSKTMKIKGKLKGYLSFCWWTVGQVTTI